jgi:nitroimidazol reductase NimA-like FMN-containing flavoprotein (pyridoxamine 5'-phosphate oxidase superfamily)
MTNSCRAINLARVIEFLIEVKRKTYAGKGLEKSTSRFNSHDLEYEEKNLKYNECMFHGGLVKYLLSIRTKGEFALFKEMRRKEKLMPKNDTVEIIKAAEYGTLASIGENGYPYSVPLNYAYENGTIYFHSAYEGNKVANIKFNNKVSFSVVTYYKLLSDKFDTEYDSAIIHGKAFEIIDEQEKKHALRLLIDKYSSDYREQGLAYIERSINTATTFKIEIEHMTGKLGR